MGADLFFARRRVLQDGVVRVRVREALHTGLEVVNMQPHLVSARAEAFVDLRERVDGDGCGNRDVLRQLAAREACLAWLGNLV